MPDREEFRLFSVSQFLNRGKGESMLHPTKRFCGSPEHVLSRRAFFGSTAGMLAGSTLGLNALAAPALADQMQRNQKSAILIFLGGGMSQFETWDPKPGTSTGGPFQSIQTSVPGVRISELMPLMATRLRRHTAIIRSLSTVDLAHSGVNLLGGERTDVRGVKAPTLGSILAKELSQPDSVVPDHVAFFNTKNGANFLDSAGFIGSRYEPTNIFSRLTPEANSLPPSITDADHRERATLRDQFNQGFLAGRQRDSVLSSHNTAYGRVRGLMASDSLFDITREPQRVRDRYGATLFGQQALVARRLVEGGVPFVKLLRGWWDTHTDNFDVHAQLVPDLDRVMSTLLDDLEDRGLLRNTLVITFSEMGRTPIINPARGRDHWGKCWSVTLSGCGIKPGVVYGSTNEGGTDVAEGKVTAVEYFATIFSALGIDHQKEYHAPDGRPVAITPYNTRAVTEVLA
jgi:hypothetical protein